MDALTVTSDDKFNSGQFESHSVPRRSPPPVKLYEKLALELEVQIDKGLYRAGERIPSVRQSSQHHRLSVTTVLKAYLLLESRGVIEGRPQSGYFVRHRIGRKANERPIVIDTFERTDTTADRLILTTLRAITAGGAIPFGSPYPDQSTAPWRKMDRYIAAAARRQRLRSTAEDLPPGNPELIRQIAKRYMETGTEVYPDEIIITQGASEAVHLCLLAIGAPGGAIAVESPTHYSILQAIERAGMRPIEIHTDPLEGLDLAQLARSIRDDSVRGCVLMPNIHHPLGCQMPEERKRALVEMLASMDTPVIEVDTYREMYFGNECPTTLKSYDRHGLVLLCSSFSKVLTSSFHIGWMMPGRYRSQIERLTFLHTPSTPSIPQIAIANYLKYESYEHHLRKLRRGLSLQAQLMMKAVQRSFPAGTRVVQPRGGYALWIELPGRTDSMTLYRLSLDDGITIAPGVLFSPTSSHRNCLRLNFGYRWTSEIEAAVVRLGHIARQLDERTTAPLVAAALHDSRAEMTF